MTDLAETYCTSEVIELAWDDFCSFDMIEKQTGLTEPEVIEIMKSNMKPSSFRMWRKRVSGRKTKHDHKLQKFHGEKPEEISQNEVQDETN